MAVRLFSPESLLPVSGISLASVAAGIYPNRDDVGLIAFPPESQVAAVFTQNRFCAAPVNIAKKHLQQAKPVNLIINAGNANAGTGNQGMNDALAVCEKVAGVTGCNVEQVIPYSTGVIGEYLPIEKINTVLPDAFLNLKEDNWLSTARAIMTTDTIPKGISRTFMINEQQITVTGIAKGSGMICPDMATMLAFVGTDIHINKKLLQSTLEEVVNQSFNRITVDGDASTNDACTLIATGTANNQLVNDSGDEAYTGFYACLLDVCQHLACAIIRDGEGATKFITLNIKGGKNQQACLDVAYNIANSPLVKTAFTASDANWGRILSAIGSASKQDINMDNVNISIGNVRIVTAGERDSNYTEEAGSAVMFLPEIILTVELGDGDASETVWTTDLSHEYIRINAEYRS